MKTYDERRQDTEPCLGNCGMLVTDPPRYCRECSVPEIRPGDLVLVRKDAARYHVVSEFHGRWLSEDADEVSRDGVVIWRRDARARSNNHSDTEGGRQ